jgi:hypothetical protein
MLALPPEIDIEGRRFTQQPGGDSYLPSDVSNHPNLFLPTDGYLFVITYGRSGSTLTQNVLNAIPGYCIRGENSNITSYLASLILRVEQEVNFTNRRHILLNPGSRHSRLIADLVGKPIDPWYGAELIDQDVVARDLFDVFVKNFLHLPAGTKVGGFKEIRFAMQPQFLASHLDILRRYFPNARFIFQTRAIGQVMKSAWWANKPAQDVKQMVLAANKAFAQYRRQNPGCTYHLRYEDYAKGPEGIRPMFEFLGADFDEGKVAEILSVKLVHGQQRPGQLPLGGLPRRRPNAAQVKQKADEV